MSGRHAGHPRDDRPRDEDPAGAPGGPTEPDPAETADPDGTPTENPSG